MEKIIDYQNIKNVIKGSRKIYKKSKIKLVVIVGSWCSQWYRVRVSTQTCVSYSYSKVNNNNKFHIKDNLKFRALTIAYGMETFLLDFSPL